MPRLASGNVIVARTRNRLAPRFLAVCSNSTSTSDRAEVKALTVRGNATTAAAIDIMNHVYAKPDRAPENGPRAPTSHSNAKPTTTGGNASGKVARTSTTCRNLLLLRAIHHAATAANGNMITNATHAARSETNKTLA